MAARKGFPIVPAALVVAALAGLGGYLITRTGPPSPAPPLAAPTMDAVEMEALARVRELEARLTAIEADKAAAEQAAAEETQTAAAPVPTPSPALLDLESPGVVAPQLISPDRNDYPPIARVRRITGTVIVSALVDEEGNVVEARIIQGVASEAGLNEAALESVRKRKYRPATRDGRAGRAWINVRIDFKL